MTTRWIIGLAPGSSADGVDAALIEAQGVGLDLKARPAQVHHLVYPRDLRDLLLQVAADGGAPKKLCLLHRLLGETFAAAAREVADRASFSLQRVQCVGCPAHTVWHETEGRFPSTLGIGMPAVVAERTGVTVVSDFPARDLAAGGQGAPLTALLDGMLFQDPSESRVLIHLGSATRITFLPAGGRTHDVLGFEAGPCSVLLDELMRQLTGGREAYDPGGKHAVQGRCIEPLLERWLAHPFLQRRPPKILPRGLFGTDFVLQAVQTVQQMQAGLHDLLCTATHFVAGAIAAALLRFLPRPQGTLRAFLSGGGVRNGLLWHLLEQQLAGIATMEKLEALGLPGEARKPLAYGLLAALTIDGVPANLPAATGAAGTRLLGSLTPGAPSNWARCLAWMASMTAPPLPPQD